MALFSGYQKNTAQNVYANMRPYLAQKDDAVHVVLINSFRSLLIRSLSAMKNTQRKLTMF
jgi:hypothetical protein